MNDRVMRCVAEIASAFVAHNHLRAEELAGLIAAVHGAVVAMDKPVDAVAPKLRPAVDLPWKKTVRPDYLISLIDGKHYKTLRRHLGLNGLTPDEYRARYELPRDYPMVSAAYSEKRSALAREIGLGQQRRNRDTLAAMEQQAAPDEGAAAVEVAPAKAGRSRRKKVAKAA